MKIKVKLFNFLCTLHSNTNGDWIDLKASKTVKFECPKASTLKRNKEDGKLIGTRNVEFDYKLIPLGIGMKLPKGFEAIIVPRSSTFKNYGITMTNSQGVIDNSYCGNDDQWQFPAIAFRDTVIDENTRIAQFRIQLSQKATIWQKIKWLFCNKIKFEYVDALDNSNRGGFGSTGV